MESGLLLALLGYRLGRHCFGCLPKEREHGQPMLEIPLARRDDTARAGDSGHLAYRELRIGELLQDKQGKCSQTNGREMEAPRRCQFENCARRFGTAWRANATYSGAGSRAVTLVVGPKETTARVRLPVPQPTSRMCCPSRRSAKQERGKSGTPPAHELIVSGWLCVAHQRSCTTWAPIELFGTS